MGRLVTLKQRLINNREKSRQALWLAQQKLRQEQEAREMTKRLQSKLSKDSNQTQTDQVRRGR